jgi:hypothetical protein
METLESPRSSLPMVCREVITRSAISCIVMRRRFRAALMSEPSFRRARLTGSGRAV